MTLRRDVAVKAFLVLVWLVCLYRAITQSIVHDEALTYGLYMGAPFGQIFQLFDANHHFLNTLLMKLSVSIFGVSEWSIRLPALAGAALYLAAVYRLSVREIRGTVASLLAVALLTLNPFVFDFMVAARGYGMALGLWMWALAILLEYVRKPDAGANRELLQAGVALSLAIMANLVFVVPALVLTAGAWAMLKTAKPTRAPELESPQVSKKRPKRRKMNAPTEHELALQAFFRWLVIPALAGCTVFFLVSPLANATQGDFYAGSETLAESLRGLYAVSLAHGGPLRQVALSPVLRDTVTFGLAPLILLGGLAVGIRRRNIILILASGSAVGCGVLLLLLHVAVNLRYPLDRTGIYFMPLIGLAMAGLVAETKADPFTKAAGALACAISVLLVAQFLLEFDTRKFVVWEYDADTRTILTELAEVAPDKRTGSVRIANSWQLEPSLNFYAMKDKLDWLQPITRAPLGPGADYYVLMPADRGAADSLHLRTIYTGRNSGTILAAPAN